MEYEHVFLDDVETRYVYKLHPEGTSISCICLSSGHVSNIHL